MNFQFTSTLEYLNSRYPPTLNVKQVAEITSEAPATINSALSRGEYPIPSFKIGSKRAFRLIDVASYIDQQFAAANSPATKKRPGRPKKVEQLARRHAGQIMEPTP